MTTILKSESGTDFGIVGFKEGKRRDLSRLSEVSETLRGQADHWNRLGACARVAALAGRPGERTFAQQMNMQMWYTFSGVGPAV